VLNHMTERQQARMFERLTELAEEFRELAAQGNESTLPLDSCLLTC
jgi:hypothetical protein